MRGAGFLAVIGLAACNGGGDDTFTVPEYQDGVLVAGDCLEDPAGVDEIGMTEAIASAASPLIDLSNLSPTEYGRVLEDEAEYEELLFSMNFGSVPILPFPGIQAIATWYHQPKACVLQLDATEVHLNTDDDGGYVLDVQFYDSALNCGPSVCATTQDLSIVEVKYFKDTDPPAKFCRRVKPGCPPPQDG